MRDRSLRTLAGATSLLLVGLVVAGCPPEPEKSVPDTCTACESPPDADDRTPKDGEVVETCKAGHSPSGCDQRGYCKWTCRGCVPETREIESCPDAGDGGSTEDVSDGSDADASAGPDGDAAGPELTSCTIAFDDSCPDESTECGASFSGGDGCQSPESQNCRTSGSRAYTLRHTGDEATIEFANPVYRVELFFAREGESGGGTMTFEDDAGDELATLETSQTACTDSSPDKVVEEFETPATAATVAAEVNASGDDVFIDDLTLYTAE